MARLRVAVLGRVLAIVRPLRAAALGRGLAALALAGLVAACGIAAPNEAASPAADAAPTQSLSAAIELTRAAVEAALRSVDLALVEPRLAFRPPESPALIDVPRGVFQVVLADDPAGGFVVIYELPSPDAANVAGLAQAAWLSSGPGAVQAPLGTRHVIRQVGATLVTFSYPPSDAADARAPEVAAALEAVGHGIPVGP